MTFLDSAAVDVLIAAHVELGLQGRELRLERPTPSVRRILHLTGVDTFLNVT